MSCSTCGCSTSRTICRECEMMQLVDEAFANNDWEADDE